MTAAPEGAARPSHDAITAAMLRWRFRITAVVVLLVAAATPQPIVERLGAAANKAMTSPDIRDRLLADGAEPVGSTPAAFRKHLDAEIAKWRKVVKSAGITAK